MNKARGKSGPVSIFQINFSFYLLCVLISFFGFWKKKKKWRAGGGDCVCTCYVAVVVLPTFQLVTKLTKEKNKR